MRVEVSYVGSSQLRQSNGGQRILDLAPNLSRDKVGLEAVLREPIRFREAISTLHDVVINDLTFKPRDKSAYEEWKKQQAVREQSIRQHAMHTARGNCRRRAGPETIHRAAATAPAGTQTILECPIPA